LGFSIIIKIRDMKRAITSLALAGLGIILIKPFGWVLLGIATARLLFQVIEWALNGGE
jgi:hypothetical protein